MPGRGARTKIRALDATLGSTWRLLRPHVKPRIGAIALVVLFGAITAAGQSALVLLINPLVDTILFPDAIGGTGLGLGGSHQGEVERALLWIQEFFSDGSMDPRVAVLVLVVGIAGVLALIGTAAQYASTAIGRWVSYNMVVDLRMRLARHLMGLSVRYHGERRLGDLLSRVSADVQTTLHSVLAAQRSFVKEPLEALAAFAFALVLQPWLTLGILVCMPIIVVPVSVLARKVRKGSTRSLASLGDSVQVLTQMFQGVRTVKAFRSEDREVARYREINDGYLKQSMRMARAIALTDAWAILFSSGGMAVLLLVVGFVHIRWGLFDEPGNMMAFFLLLSQIYNHSKSMTRSYTQVEESVGASQRLLALLDESADLAERPDPLPLAGLGSGIRFENVSFLYPTSQEPALAGLDLHVRPGEKLAVVGPSGAGKSTLIDLLCRFIDPTDGRITVDGVDLRDASLDRWTELYGLVDQVPFLFHSSIAENIRYGKPDSTQEELEAAARAAQIHDHVVTMPEGYDTNVADQGTRLSGGQRQRITIARALLKDAPLLLLDEATSSLDSESEAKVQQALDRLMADRTVIVVAHRLSTVRGADRIAVLEAGRLVELGSHEELLRRGGAYARLVRAQELVGDRSVDWAVPPLG